MKRITFIFAILTLLVFFPMNNPHVTESDPTILNIGKNKIVVDQPIVIDGNLELANFTSEGTGTEIDPYIVENYNIQTTNNHGVEIRNTDVYFILRNVIVNGSGSTSGDYVGFYFSNVVNAQIEKNLVMNYYHGFYLTSSCNYNLLTTNTATNNEAGFYLTRSSNNTLTANSATNNRDGFSLWYSSSNTLTNNTAINTPITGIGHGFGLDSSSNFNILTNNTATNNNEGFSLMSSCSSNILINNKAIQNNFNGFSLSTSSNNTFSNNTALNNRNGFSLSSSNSNVLTNNIIKTNVIYGITITTGSITNTIHWNKFIHNNYQTGSSQGYDDGTNNIFAQNYWNDHITPDSDNDGIVDIPYQLDGSAISRDFTPVTSAFPIPPDIDSPTDIGYLEHATGHTITWIITDDNPTTYTIIRNWTLIVSGSWSSPANITINVDGLSPAIYEYTITVTDADGLTASDIVYVNVIKLDWISSDSSDSSDSYQTTWFSPLLFLFILGVYVYLKWFKTNSN